MKFLFLLNLLLLFSPLVLCSPLDASSRERGNEAWHHIIQLVVSLCDKFISFKHLYLIISSFG